MAILARFTAGKRLNLIQRNSFDVRSQLTGLRYNKGLEWHYEAWKKTMDRSPGTHFKTFMAAEHRAQLQRKKEELFLKQTKLQQLQITKDMRNAIAKETIGQFENVVYRKYKENRLTALVFGEVVRREDTTPCHNLVKKILKGCTFQNDATSFGIRKEAMVREKFASQYNLKIKQCGLYIDLERGYLAASPDGITENEDAIIEIKCLKSVADKGISLEDAAQKGNICVRKEKDGKLHLKKTHHYYYQVQGQLNITECSKCYFVVYSGEQNNLFVEEINKDGDFWYNVMVPRLEMFYQECVLREIIHNRIGAGLPCSDPEYILQAIQKKNEKN